MESLETTRATEEEEDLKRAVRTDAIDLSAKQSLRAREQREAGPKCGSGCKYTACR
jgi:hypothetical protein